MKKREPGMELDAYCTKCKIVLAHVIVAMNGTRVARVQCKTCDGLHAYRASVPGSRAAKGGRKKAGGAPSYEELMQGRDVSSARSYKGSAKFEEGEVLSHTTFGLGLVTRVLADAKMEVSFSKGNKVLIHDRAS